MSAKKGQNVGESNPFAKLTRSKVIDMRKRYKLGESSAKLARRYGVTQGAVLNALKGKSWGHLPGVISARTTRGENNSQCILSETDVRSAVQLYNAGQSMEAVAELFGVSRGAIQNIFLRKSWRHLDLDISEGRARRQRLIGSMQGRALLDEESAADVKRHIAAGVSEHRIAAMYRISRSAVTHVKQGDTWRHVPWPEGYFNPAVVFPGGRPSSDKTPVRVRGARKESKRLEAVAKLRKRLTPPPQPASPPDKE
jgi:predicted DNA-binding protein YlxM (UPF0122 family)